jgi:hypothetical protein
MPRQPAPPPPALAPAAGAPPELPKWVPHGAGLHLEDVVVDEDGIAVVAAPRPAGAPCPVPRVWPILHRRP